MDRPLRLPIFGRTPAVREEPIAGTESAGYAFGDTPAAKHHTWLFWDSGEWIDYLQRRAMNATELVAPVSSTSANRISFTQMTFLVGGPLAQRPVTGGVYRISLERCDATVITGPDCPVYNFTPSSNNYVWMRPRQDNSRSAYPEVTVTTTLVQPGPGYMRVRDLVTGVATVTSDVESSTVVVGHEFGNGLQTIFRSNVKIAPAVGLNATTLEIQTRQAFSPAVTILTELGQTNDIIQPFAQPNQRSYVGGSTGSDTPVFYSFIGVGGVDKAKGFMAESFSSDAVGFHAQMGESAWPLAITPTVAGTIPHTAGINATRFRAFVNNQSGTAAGFRWRDASGIDRLWVPWASIHGQVLRHQRNADSGAIGSGGTPTLITMAAVSFRQNHRYTITLECETICSGTWTGTVAVTITIGGVADALWNARQYRPNATGLANTWLSTRITYTHAGADTDVATIVLSVVHGVSALGSINYLAPRITQEGALFP